MKKKVLELGMNLCGNFLLAISVCAFTVPFDITVGGATGVGVICEKALGIPIARTVLAVNLICLPLAGLFVGRKLVSGSLLSSLLYPLALAIVERIPDIETWSDSVMLSTVFAGVIGGLGVGLIMKAGGSTGGLDIPPVIFLKKFRVPIRTSMFIMDGVILLGQLPFCETDRILYGILMAYIFTYTIDRVLMYEGKRRFERN